MKKIIVVLGLFMMTMCFSGCIMTKQVAYFQNMDSISISDTTMLPEIRIKPNDELVIIVSSVTAEAAEPFNMNLGVSARSSSMNSSLASRSMWSYIVDDNGDINFPVVGKIPVKGLTRTQCENKITKVILPYFTSEERPVVKVRYNGFKVTIIGEVGSARVLEVDNERMSIIEALARSGDLSIYGKRPNVLLVREDANGKKTSHRFNLNDANIFNSPYYFLQQNDIIYVEPQKARARSADVSSYTFWTPIASVLISMSTFVISLTK